MTEPLRAPASPAEPLAQPVEVPPPGSSDKVLLAALVVALVAGAGADLITRILGRFAGLTASVVGQVMQRLGWSSLLTAPAQDLSLLPRSGSPSVTVLHQTAIQNAFRTATYLVNAARRMAPAIASGDETMIGIAQQREERFQEAHADMERRRNEAGRQVAEVVDGMAPNAKGEVLLGWKSRRGPKSCPTCLKAHGRNFNALVRPRIGYPGEVHMWCECLPRKPWPNTTLWVESTAVPEHR